ncbi:MAG: restriction endonuclease subunit S [Oscillospiraceae bacterium]
MLVPKLRFKEFNNDWKEKKLNEISFEVKRKTTNTNYEVLTISAKKGFVSQKERFSKIIAGGSLEKYNLLKRNEISYNKGASKSFKYGCVYIQKQYDYALVPNVYISFSFINNNPYFYEKLFENHYLDKSLRMLITSTARQDGLLNIDRKQFFNIKVPVPSLEEQTKIANFLSLIDRKIELQEKLVDSLNLYKKGLLLEKFVRGGL